LRCAWCANPESQRFQPELALSASQCIRCGQFEDFCADVWDHGAITQAEREKFGLSNRISFQVSQPCFMGQKNLFSKN
jgi:pyruvate-formate lyase-activating enzyme